MNSTQLAGIFILATGMLVGTAVAQPQSQPQTQQVQANLGNTGLNAIYAYDDQGNFASILFTDDEARYFATQGGISELNQDSAQICFQYVETTQDGVLGGLFAEGDTESVVDCQELQMGNGTQGQQIPPFMNQTQNETPEGFGEDLEENFTQENQTQQQQNMTPTMFYAYDDQGNYINLVLNDQGQISNVLGSVSSIDQLDQETMVACEYFLQQDGENSEVNCYNSQELQNRIQDGSITYLPLEENQTEQENGQQGDQGGDGFDLPFV